MPVCWTQALSVLFFFSDVFFVSLGPGMTANFPHGDPWSEARRSELDQDLVRQEIGLLVSSSNSYISFGLFMGLVLIDNKKNISQYFSTILWHIKNK